MRIDRIIAVWALLSVPLAASAQSGSPKFHGAFKEDFSAASSEYFNYNYRPSGEDFRYCSGIPSLSENGTDIMLYRIDPDDPAGAGRGPEIISKDYTFYGSYSARFKVPDVRKAQPDAGLVVGYFTYNIDREFGQSEIDIEVLLADPRIIYVGTWTGKRGAHNRIGRIVNLATGEILETIWRSEVRHPDGAVTKIPNTPFAGRQNKPAKIEAIEGFDASADFYTYGWDWYPDRLVWWIINPQTGKKLALWDYKGKDIFPDQPSKTGVPCLKSRYRLNFWHTSNWPVETNPESVEAPRYPYELEIDWMAYEPFGKFFLTLGD
ncbi:MAG: glycoside hydrolase family 16 protein [Bacteroidales bacterium]|nr:glycoside hydrolase family 16 protein [Bacteroidales bacterium]